MAVPVLAPLQVMLGVLNRFPVNGISEVKIVVAVDVQPVPRSKVESVYVFGFRLFATENVCAVGDHVYENGPIPPEGNTVALPRLAQVMEAVIKERAGTGRMATEALALPVQPKEEVPVTV
jgi:hypothetical protein